MIPTRQDRAETLDEPAAPTKVRWPVISSLTARRVVVADDNQVIVAALQSRE